MNDFGGTDVLVLAVLVVPAGLVSFLVGRWKAAAGAPFVSSLAAGFGCTALAIVAVTAVLGALIARAQLMELADDRLWELQGDGLSARLHESDVEWERVPCECWGCQDVIWLNSRETRARQVSEAQTVGYGFPLLAPVFGLLALLPSVMATTLGYNVGSRRRAEVVMWATGGE